MPRQSQDWIDISAPVRTGMIHWPTDQAVEIKRTLDIEKGDSHTLSTLIMGSHTGTHVDSPLHFLRGGAAVDRMALDATIGPARVIESQGDAITAEELEGHRIRKGERILFRTRNSLRRWYAEDFRKDYAYLTSDAARYLAERRLRCAGIDYLSIGGYRRDGAAVHEALLGAGVWIIEGLNLEAAAAGRYYMVCLPLRLVGCDGAPARAALRPLNPRG